MKSIDLIIGVLKETRARRIVAVRVTRNPGVAGFIVVVVMEEGRKEFYSKDGDGNCDERWRLGTVRRC